MHLGLCGKLSDMKKHFGTQKIKGLLLKRLWIDFWLKFIFYFFYFLFIQAWLSVKSYILNVIVFMYVLKWLKQTNSVQTSISDAAIFTFFLVCLCISTN